MWQEPLSGHGRTFLQDIDHVHCIKLMEIYILSNCHKHIYTWQKKKVVQLKNANISQKIYGDIVDMHLFLKLI